METHSFLRKATFFFAFLCLANCGPVIVSSQPALPTPAWFYPNRVVNLRYVYFPDYIIYFDLKLRHYVYLDNGVWRTSRVLPPRYSTLNLRRARQERVRNYFDDDIRSYHSRRQAPSDSPSRSTRSNSGTTRRRG